MIRNDFGRPINSVGDDEVHRKIAAGLESLRQGKGLDGEAAMAELIAELGAPEYTGAK